MVLEYLRSRTAVIVVLVAALLAQMPHAQYVFMHYGHDQGLLGKIEAWFAAFALELAVLVFVAQSNKGAAWGFALFSVAINMVYYHETGATWYMPQPQWLLSAGLPIAIALYSHQVADGTGHGAVVQPDSADAPLEVPSVVQPDVQAECIAPPAQPDAQRMDEVAAQRAKRAAQLKGEGLSNAQIAMELNVHRNTVGRLLKVPA